MRRVFGVTLCAVVLSLIAAAPASAQSLWVSPGITFPTGDFGEFADAGWMAAGGLNFPVGEGSFWVGPGLYYGSNGHETDGESTDQFGFMANAGINTAEQGETGLFFFGSTGFGSHAFKSDTEEDETDWGPYLGAGAGLSTPLGESNNFFIGGRYFHGLGDLEDTNYFSIFAGIGFAIGGDDGM